MCPNRSYPVFLACVSTVSSSGSLNSKYGKEASAWRVRIQNMAVRSGRSTIWTIAPATSARRNAPVASHASYKARRESRPPRASPQKCLEGGGQYCEADGAELGRLRGGEGGV